MKLRYFLKTLNSFFYIGFLREKIAVKNVACRGFAAGVKSANKRFYLFFFFFFLSPPPFFFLFFLKVKSRGAPYTRVRRIHAIIRYM